MMVSIAVIALLIALLFPSLSTARKAAQQVICRSNVRQVGLAIALYADDWHGMIPPSALTAEGGASVADTMTLRFVSPRKRASSGWDGLGHLYETEILPAPGVFYCPSHRGEHPFRAYSERWSHLNGEIVGNYQYRGGDASGRPGSSTAFLSAIVPRDTALVADGLRTAEDFNHVTGANVLLADLSVIWFEDDHGTVMGLLGKDGEATGASQILQAWAMLGGGG